MVKLLDVNDSTCSAYSLQCIDHVRGRGFDNAGFILWIVERENVGVNLTISVNNSGSSVKKSQGPILLTNKIT